MVNSVARMASCHTNYHRQERPNANLSNTNGWREIAEKQHTIRNWNRSLTNISNSSNIHSPWPEQSSQRSS